MLIYLYNIMPTRKSKAGRRKPRTVRSPSNARFVLERIKRTESLQPYIELSNHKKIFYSTNKKFILKILSLLPILHASLDDIVEYIDPSLIEDFDFMIRAIKYTPQMMKYAADELFDDITGLQFISTAYNANQQSVLYLPLDEYDKYPIIKHIAAQQYDIFRESHTEEEIEGITYTAYLASLHDRNTNSRYANGVPIADSEVDPNQYANAVRI